MGYMCPAAIPGEGDWFGLFEAGGSFSMRNIQRGDHSAWLSLRRRIIAPEDDGAKVGSHEIERRLVGSMRNCITKISSLFPRSKTRKKRLAFEDFQNRQKLNFGSKIEPQTAETGLANRNQFLWTLPLGGKAHLWWISYSVFEESWILLRPQVLWKTVFSWIIFLR